MKNLTYCITTFLIIILFTSCNSYQIVTLKSPLPQPSSNGFLFENDTVSVLYTFNGQNAPLDVNIFNKSNTPLYINWSQSSVIINGQAFPLNPAQSKVNVDYSEVSTEFYNSSYTEGYADGTIWHSDRSGFIPPQANTTIQSMNLWNTFLSNANAINEYKITNAKGSKVTQYVFNQDGSPLDVRCFISYSSKPKESWTCMDHHFWVESFYKCVDCPLPKEGNMFYLSKTTGAGTALGVVAAIGATALIISSGSDALESDF